jgi:hypothetical protein
VLSHSLIETYFGTKEPILEPRIEVLEIARQEKLELGLRLM